MSIVFPKTLRSIVYAMRSGIRIEAMRALLESRLSSVGIETNPTHAAHAQSSTLGRLYGQAHFELNLQLAPCPTHCMSAISDNGHA